MSDRTVEVDSQLLRGWPLEPPGGGTALVVGGSRQSPGGALLAAEAALRAGAVKVQVVTVESAAGMAAVALPEVYVAGAAETDAGELGAAVDTAMTSAGGSLSARTRAGVDD